MPNFTEFSDGLQFALTTAREFGYTGEVRDEKGKMEKKRINIGPFDIRLPALEQLRDLPDAYWQRDTQGNLINPVLSMVENALAQKPADYIRQMNADAIQSSDADSFTLNGVPQSFADWQARLEQTGFGVGEARKVMKAWLAQFFDSASAAKSVPRTTYRQYEKALNDRDSLEVASPQMKKIVTSILDSFEGNMTASDADEETRNAYNTMLPAITEARAAIAREVKELNPDDFDF